MPARNVPVVGTPLRLLPQPIVSQAELARVLRQTAAAPPEETLRVLIFPDGGPPGPPP